MNTFHDYESMGCVDSSLVRPPVLESYSGTKVVEWYGNIERQLVNLLKDNEKSKNWAYADKIRKFLEIWRSNELTGSINRETLEVLKSPADVLAVDNWNLSNYFSNLRDRIRMLVASEEQLPRGVDMDKNDPMAGGGGGRGAPPLDPSFGPEEEPPGAGGPEVDGPLDGAEGEGGEGGGPGGAEGTDEFGPGGAQDVPGTDMPAGGEAGAGAPGENERDDAPPFG